MSTRLALIDARNLRVRRGGNTILDGFSLRIEQGQSTALLGPNGAGKTTFLRLLTRNLYPVVQPGSHLRILGRERFSVFALRRRMGIVSHELQQELVSALTGLEAVLSGFRASTRLDGTGFVPGERERQAAERTLCQLGVAEQSGVRFDRMSTGQQRRTLLARALVHEPPVLVLDEPTAGLDLGASLAFGGLLQRLLREGRTIVLATHRVSEIPSAVDRVVMLKACRVFRDGSKAEILTSANVSSLYDTPVQVVRDGPYYLTRPADRDD